MHFEIFEGVCLCVHAPVPPNDTEWAAWCEFSATAHYDKMLVYPGASEGPNSKQRERSATTYKAAGKTARQAVITDSGLVRGILTAMHWLGVATLRAFSKKQWPAALTHLQVPPERHAAVQSRVQQILTQLEGNTSSALH